MQSNEFKGTHACIGQEYGKTFDEQISENMDILVKRNEHKLKQFGGADPLPLNDPDFKKWVDVLLPDIREWAAGAMPDIPINSCQILDAINKGMGGRQWLWRLISGMLWIQLTGVKV